MANSINNIMNVFKAFSETENYGLFEKIVMGYKYDGESQRDIAAACYALARTGVFRLSSMLGWTLEPSDSFVEIANALDEYNRGELYEILLVNVDPHLADELGVDEKIELHIRDLFREDAIHTWIARRTGSPVDIDFQMKVDAAERNMNLSDW